MDRRPEFDRYATRYGALLDDALLPTGVDSDRFAAYKIEEVAHVLAGRNIERILDFGCGPGRSMPHFRRAFPEAELFGFDPSPECAAAARGLAFSAEGRIRLCRGGECISSCSARRAAGSDGTMCSRIRLTRFAVRLRAQSAKSANAMGIQSLPLRLRCGDARSRRDFEAWKGRRTRSGRRPLHAVCPLGRKGVGRTSTVAWLVSRGRPILCQVHTPTLEFSATRK
jgi:SAM-dependent methyltransferase